MRISSSRPSPSMSPTLEGGTLAPGASRHGRLGLVESSLDDGVIGIHPVGRSWRTPLEAGPAASGGETLPHMILGLSRRGKAALATRIHRALGPGATGPWKA